jgi:alkanesulfonate monooxygenase SsuD/methylene tetrahydromethanopterin reductase-like flavin-dependent oxidoreductase (luciferase family)
LVAPWFAGVPEISVALTAPIVTEFIVFTVVMRAAAHTTKIRLGSSAPKLQVDTPLTQAL